MRTVNIHHAKTHLSKLVEEAAKGEPFVIAKAGKPMVQVIPLAEAAADRPMPKRRGFMAGQFTVPDDFDTMFQDEIIAMFEGGDIFPEGEGGR